jgi:hypothetical protein
MTFLQTITTRKPLKRKDLSPGNGGGYPLPKEIRQIMDKAD